MCAHFLWCITCVCRVLHCASALATRTTSVRCCSLMCSSVCCVVLKCAFLLRCRWADTLWHTDTCLRCCHASSRCCTRTRICLWATRGGACLVTFCLRSISSACFCIGTIMCAISSSSSLSSRYECLGMLMQSTSLMHVSFCMKYFFRLFLHRDRNVPAAHYFYL